MLARSGVKMTLTHTQTHTLGPSATSMLQNCQTDNSSQLLSFLPQDKDATRAPSNQGSPMTMPANTGRAVDGQGQCSGGGVQQ
mmetsp:Transcript_52534/g.107127  ORF Transcript_52534/g.107127 Transcript_52534/m.107127 type:complete len:83 (+) Transcript_52534:89-337(+)